jgi:Mor family transcriptional regulator
LALHLIFEIKNKELVKMGYVKASKILPQKLISEIQKYVQGEMIYIPKTKTSRQQWGARSGTRQFIDDRNTQIKEAYQNGATFDQLAEEYHLSPETIKKIVYTR